MARRKRKTPKPKRKRNPLIYLFFFILFIIATLYVMSLPIWQIKEVVVNGAVMLSDSEIKTLAAIPLSENLFFTSFKRARNNLGKITAIEKASFYRIPPGTVLISLKERRPIAAIILSDRSIVIDQAGYIINRNPNLTLNISNLAELPVVSGIDPTEIKGTEKVSPKTAKLVSDLIEKLLPYVDSKKMQIELGGLEDVNLLLDDILSIKFGRAEQIKRKMEVIEGLLTVIEGQL